MGEYIERVKGIGVARAVGIAAVVWGCILVCMNIAILLRSLHMVYTDGIYPHPKVFMLPIEVVSATPYVFSIYYGLNLMQEQNKATIKCAVAMVSLFTSLILAILFPLFSKGEFLFVNAPILFFLLYIPTSIFLMKKHGLEPKVLDFVTIRTFVFIFLAMYFSSGFVS